MELIKLRVYNVGNKGSININPKLIETVIVSPYNNKYILILALSQGARYQLATSEGKYLFDTKEEAEAELNTILAECSQDIFITVSELPPTGEPNKIYLVPSTDPESQNTLDEYIWIDNDWELIGNISVDLDAYNIRFNGSGTNYLVGETEVEGAVKELDTRVKTNADNVALKVDTSDIVDDLVSTDVDKPLSANQGKVLNDKKVDKTQTIIGLDLQDNILIGEFRTALGNATQSVAGLLSAADKTHLDSLVALLETSDSNNVVDTIGEILAIFQNYPEGADLVTVLQGKVDKVAGKGLSTNDFTDEYKNKLDGIEVGAEVNPYSKTQLDNMFDDKVDKVSGKGLSTNDLTNTLKTNYDTAYTHSQTAHAPSNAQKNSDITKAEIEAKLTGQITTHNHDDRYYTETEIDTKLVGKANTTHTHTKSQISDLIEATQSLSGLMSATDKQRLDVLHSLLEEDTANNVVDSINEVLAIFNNYPEGADLVTALAGKVDKVTGKGLSENDLTDILKSNYDTAYSWGDHAVEGYLKAITKAMVEAVLTGTINTHNHSGTYEPAFTKNTAFNKNFGTSLNTVAQGNHLHEGVYEPANSNIQSHISSTSNPHGVTKADVGLGSVQNYAIATKAQAESGTSNALYMTPLRTKEAITAAMGDIESALDAILGV